MTVKSAIDAKTLNDHVSPKKSWILYNMVMQNRHLAVAQLTAEYNAIPVISVSEHPVQWILLDMGLHS